jgi:putative cell wall-binding protein
VARRPPVLAALLAVVASTLALPEAGAWTRDPVRVAGTDRYETAVRISARTFPQGAPTVVLASGESYPDALAAGPLAALNGGPVLTTTRAALPPATRVELDRLAPRQVFVVGGPAAVADEVLAEVRAVAEVEPVRLAGVDRYATASAVAARFPAPAPVAMVASGTGFADALAGGAAAALAGGPLLLAPPTGLPATVLEQLQRLTPAQTLVLGGSAAVPDAVVSQLPGPSQRLAGPDRYGTAAAIAQFVAPAADQVVVATGNAFADALAAAPMAASLRAPVVLTSGCLPPASHVLLSGGGSWRDLTIVGGTAAVSERGLAEPCSPVPDGVFADGLTLQTIVDAGPVVTRLVGITPAAGWTLRFTTGTGAIPSTRLTTEVARRLGARFAVNGSFFLTSGDPTYSLAIDGRLVRAPGAGFSNAIGVNPADPASTAIVVPDYRMRLGDMTVHKVNSGAPGAGEVALVTRESTRTVEVGSAHCRAVLLPQGAPALNAEGAVDQAYVVGPVSCDASPLRSGPHDVVAAPEGTAEAEAIRTMVAGEATTFTWRFHPTVGGVTDVLGAHYRLVQDGQLSTDVLPPNTTGFFAERAPRTALCLMPNGAHVLAVVDGRQRGYSLGYTPRQLAELLLGLGCAQAVNLDGGGSTTLSVDGVLANRPSDASGQRRVSTFVYVAPRG